MSSNEPIPLHAALGLTTGYLWGDLSPLHHAIERLLGRSVWTHEMASKSLMDEIQRRAQALWPALADVPESAKLADCPEDRVEAMAFAKALTADVAARVGFTEVRFPDGYDPEAPDYVTIGEVAPRRAGHRTNKPVVVVVSTQDPCPEA